jgi:uncharacterized protein (TIGR02217 family)
MTGFHEVRFPDNIAYGATDGPEFATTVVATGAGHEKRNVNWAEARGRWDVASGLKKQAQTMRAPLEPARARSRPTWHARSIAPGGTGRKWPAPLGSG